jgi:hypothetical protein
LGKKDRKYSLSWKQALLLALRRKEYKWFSPDRVATALPAFWEQINYLKNVKTVFPDQLFETLRLMGRRRIN